MAEPAQEPTLVGVSHGAVTDVGNNWHVVRYKTMSDGTVQEGCHIISKEAMEWRAAEYGIDPTDLNTLLDIILIEPYLIPAEVAQGASLITADTIAEARDAHVARIVAAKLRLRVSTQSTAAKNVLAVVPGPQGQQQTITFLDVIRAGSPIDEEAIEEKKKLVRRMRRSEKLVQKNTSRVEKLRQHNRKGDDNG